MAKAKLSPPDPSAPYDPSRPCPQCNQAVPVYLPPERGLGGPQAYPALLLHYEKQHPEATPPPPPTADDWDPAPPAPKDWRPLDLERAKRQLRQEDGVWPPVRVAELPL